MRGLWILVGILIMASASVNNGQSRRPGQPANVLVDPKMPGSWQYSINGSKPANMPNNGKLLHEGNCYWISGSKLMHQAAANGSCN